MLSLLRKIIPEDSILRLAYSWSKALLAKVKYGNPSRDLVVIGITGTDGKTSTTHFTAQLLEELGLKVAMSSTEEIWMAGDYRDNATKRTTLSPFTVQAFLQEAKENKCDVAIIEVSSHALVQGRVFGTEFDGAVVTNISQEHGNYHKDLEEYAQVKSRLFELVHKNKQAKKKILVLNKDMEFYDMFARINPEIAKTYAIENNDTDITAKGITTLPESSNFNIEQDTNSEKATLNVAGTYNIENMLAASLIAEFFGFSLKDVAKQFAKIRPVAGRLEEIDTSTGFRVFIDFALTPGALEKLLTYAQDITAGNVILVFGCTGANHDQIKRPMMGKVSSTLADYVVVTEDESYGEDNENIMSDIESGFRKDFVAYKKINNRGEAIDFALSNAKAGDTILITGMGAFTSRNDGEKEIPWSDRECVETFLKNNK